MAHMVISLIAMFVLAGCVPPGQIRKHTTPGHIQKSTGYNPASGKYKGATGHGSDPDVNIIITP